jgi:hypothetical protein
LTKPLTNDDTVLVTEKADIKIKKSTKVFVRELN